MSDGLSVRDRIKRIQVELRDTDVGPGRSRDMLIELTALYGNCADELREAEAVYADVLLASLMAEAKANRARMVAEATPAYARKRQAQDVCKLVVELIRSLKAVLRSSQEEMRLGQ